MADTVSLGGYPEVLHRTVGTRCEISLTDAVLAQQTATAHDLYRIPDGCYAWLECVEDDTTIDYFAGDRIPFTGGTAYDDPVAVEVSFTDEHVFVITATANLRPVSRISPHTATALTTASWKIVAIPYIDEPETVP